VSQLRQVAICKSNKELSATANGERKKKKRTGRDADSSGKCGDVSEETSDPSIWISRASGDRRETRGGEWGKRNVEF